MIPFHRMPKKILLITLSNIGDVVLTTPVLQHLLNRPDQPAVSVMVGPKAAELFQNDPALQEIIVYDKHAGWIEKLKVVRKLRTKHFNEIVDLRRTLFPLLILGWKGLLWRSWFRRVQRKQHAVLAHLHRAFGQKGEMQFRIFIPEQAEQRAEELLRENKEPFVAVAPGAASDLKRWPLERFSRIIRRLQKEFDAGVILVGGDADRELVAPLRENIPGIVDLTGNTSLTELAAVIKRSMLLLTNDSGPMHIAAAVGTPVVAIFGPSDHRRYGPLGQFHKVVRLDLPCSPCGQAQCPLGTHACMQDLDVEKVWASVASVIESSHAKAL